MKTTQIAAGVVLALLAVSASAQQPARKSYIIELADQPAAAYDGRIAGYQATRPAAGQRFRANASAVQAYVTYLDSKQRAVAAAVPAAKVTYKYRNVLNGFAAMLTDAEFQKLVTHPGVRAITVDTPRALDTSYTPTFLGINQPGGVWSKLDSAGRAIKGEGVIVGHVDGGVWPENPSFSDKVDATGKPVASHLPGTVVYDPLPAGRYTGGCQVGPGITAANCNNKLVGAQVFNETWKLAESLGFTTTWPYGYVDSARDEDGHGSHTLSTAGGNENVTATVNGTTITGVSGIAPRARVAAYKVCFVPIDAATGGKGRAGCYPSDSVAAIDKAVADGVDVINFSISGSQTSFRDAVEVAFFNAASSGVFVAASAGNSGPGNTVAHLSPWIATVGNSTHDRFTVADVTLGNGAMGSGPSFQTAGLPSSPIILSVDAGVVPYASLTTDADRVALGRCYNASDRGTLGGSASAALDPAKIAGKILVCYRGGNVLVNKTQEAKDDGAVGAIIQNIPAGVIPGGASANTTFNIAHAVPTVHIPASFAPALIAYIGSAGAGATASFGPGLQVAGVVAPVMASSSSRGPNKADPDVLKPDITGPGTDIIAAYTNESITPAQHGEIIAGTLIPGPGANMISGTSMSSPHVAGAAALLKQANPTWSPYAIKSALMSSAAQSVKLANGAVDNDRWGFGAGHLNPNGALETKLVYDSTAFDHLDYYFGDIPAWELNLASMTRSSVVGAGSVTRRLTNKGDATVTYTAAASLPGYNVVVSPASLTLAPGATGAFTTTVTRTTAAIGAWSFGDVTWTGDGRTVRSPLSVRGLELVAPSVIEDTRNVGTKVMSVATGYTGRLYTTAVGLVPATLNSGRVATGAQVCYPFSVAAGARQVRVQMRNVDVEGGAGSDLDITVYRGGAAVGGSYTGSSEELVVLIDPAAGSYEACVEGYAPTGGEAGFTVANWVVGPAVGPQTLRAFGAARVVTGGTASVGIMWNVPAGPRYVGVVDFRSTPAAAPIGSATVFIDTSAAAAAATASAEVLRDKAPR